MKSSFQNQEPKALNYRKYKFFNNENFRTDLFYAINKSGVYNMSCEQFESLFIATLNQYAPLMKRYLRANNSPFMTNNIYKAIMMRTQLRNMFLRLKTVETRVTYNKQRNHCVSLIRNAKKHFFENLYPNLITDNTKLWKQVKPFSVDDLDIDRGSAR